jgi:hypothetical protein
MWRWPILWAPVGQLLSLDITSSFRVQSKSWWRIVRAQNTVNYELNITTLHDRFSFNLSRWPAAWGKAAVGHHPLFSFDLRPALFSDLIGLIQLWKRLSGCRHVERPWLEPAAIIRRPWRPPAALNLARRPSSCVVLAILHAMLVYLLAGSQPRGGTPLCCICMSSLSPMDKGHPFAIS